MPPAHDQIDLETLLREVISGVAVTAYARGIGISAHIDNRLPTRVLGDAAALSGFLRRGIARTIEAGRTKSVALAFWHDDAGPEVSQTGLLLEACRAMEGGDTSPIRMVDLWALPINCANAHPVRARQSDGAETVLIALPCGHDTGAPPVAQTWGSSFDGRYLLHVFDLLYDHQRFRASLAAAGLEATFATTSGVALELAQSRADNGQKVDLLVLNGHRQPGEAVALAREFSADPRLAGTRIVLTGETRKQDLSSDEAALFDAVPQASSPWRRLMYVLHDLARAPEEAPPPQSAVSRTAGAIPDMAGRRILIAEDVPTNQVLLTAVLAPTGAEVEVVADGAAVLKRHAQAPADLILMDLQMPGMGGIAAMRRLRQMGGTAGGVPVVALTAYARSADRQMALDAGMDAYLAKPVVVTEFYDLLRRLLPADGATGEGAAGEGAAS